MYLVQIWSLLAPPVFISVLFGLFYKRANAKAAITTIAFGSILGLIAFLVINLSLLSSIKKELPIYFQNSLNVGFVITLLCGAVMVIVSHSTGSSPKDLAKAKSIRESKITEKMSPRETKIYRLTLAGCFLFWLSVFIAFSPLGFGH